MASGNLSSFHRKRGATKADDVDLDHAEGLLAVGASHNRQQTLHFAGTKENSFGGASQELSDDLEDPDSDEDEQNSQQQDDDSDLSLLASQRESKENLQILDNILTKQAEIR